jgi:hypothetical protein
MNAVILQFAQLPADPVPFLVVSLLAVLLLLAAVRVLFSIAWRVIAVAALLFFLLWLVGAVSLGPL